MDRRSIFSGIALVSKRWPGMAAVVFAALASTVQAAGSGVRVDQSGKGAVWCAWGLYENIHLIGERCFAEEDEPLQGELRPALQRIDCFIIVNSATPITQAQLNERRSAMNKAADQAEAADPSKAFCRKADVVKAYQLAREQGVQDLRAQEDDLLSVPREPLFSPCM